VPEEEIETKIMVEINLKIVTEMLEIKIDEDSLESIASSHKSRVVLSPHL
jgi:hypothetical protein